MDILDKAYDYIDYTLEQLAKLEETSVSLLYFFKLFSPAGKLAQHLLIEHSFIEIEGNDNRVTGITERGRAVLTMGGIRQYLDHLDMQHVVSESRIKKLRKVLIATACVAGSVLLFFILKNRFEV
jgi:hypothetical protein